MLGLYAPDRSQTLTHLGRPVTWEAGLRARTAAVEKRRESRGAGLRLLTETVVSPTLAGQIGRLLEDFPAAKWNQYEPLARDFAYAASMQAFGEPVDCAKADVVLSLYADFVTHGPGDLRYVADFMARRRVRTTAEGAKDARMNRLYAVETALTSKGGQGRPPPLARMENRDIVRSADLLVEGFGVWGLDIPVAWGFAITNFIWWIGIGHAGTLIYLPSSWGIYRPTIWDYLTYFGTIGLFFMLLLLFLRLLPVISISEMRAMLPGAAAKEEGR